MAGCCRPLGKTTPGERARKEKKRGPRLGTGTPKGRAPLIRPRRDRIMGSSILASLSEAGGNDPCHPANGPLPPQLLGGADRVKRDPRDALCKSRAYFEGLTLITCPYFSIT